LRVRRWVTIGKLDQFIPAKGRVRKGIG